MTKQKYVYDGFENIEGVEGEKTVYTLNIKDVFILVTEEPKDSIGEEYFNVYFIDEVFRKEPLNNLREQIPKGYEPKNPNEWKRYLEKEYIRFFAWREFNLYVEDIKEDEEI